MLKPRLIMRFLVLAIVFFTHSVYALDDTYFGVDQTRLAYVFKNAGDYWLWGAPNEGEDFSILIEKGTYTQLGSAILHLVPTETQGSGLPYDVEFGQDDQGRFVPYMLVVGQAGRFMAYDGVDSYFENRPPRHITTFNLNTGELFIPSVLVWGQQPQIFEQVTAQLVNSTPVTLQITGALSQHTYDETRDTAWDAILYQTENGDFKVNFYTIDLYSDWQFNQQLKEPTLQFNETPQGLFLIYTP
jgi:hypothetical protein